MEMNEAHADVTATNIDLFYFKRTPRPCYLVCDLSFVSTPIRLI